MNRISAFFSGVLETPHGPALVKALDRMGLSAIRDGFLYEIAMAEGTLLRVYVTRYGGSDGGPNVKILGEKEEDPRVVLLRIFCAEQVMEKVLSGRLSPVQATMNGQATVVGDLKFVMRYPAPVTEFFTAVTQAYKIFCLTAA